MKMFYLGRFMRFHGEYYAVDKAGALTWRPFRTLCLEAGRAMIGEHPWGTLVEIWAVPSKDGELMVQMDSDGELELHEWITYEFRDIGFTGWQPVVALLNEHETWFNSVAGEYLNKPFYILWRAE